MDIFEKMNRLEYDFAWANQITDELMVHQPFLASMMAGYKFDLPPQEMDEVLKLYVAVWEFFKTDPIAKVTAITESQFDRLHTFNVNLMTKNDSVDGATISVLLSVIIQRFGTRPTFKQMNVQKLGALIVGIKSTIECFQELVM